MGTRNLTAVYIDGEYKVAQYGQWDGYPEGQGITCLRFLKNNMQEDLFKTKVRGLRYLSSETVDGIVEKCKLEGSRWAVEYPQLTRDTGAEILQYIQNGHCDDGVCDNLVFAAESLMCEWAYVIDFDKRTFEVYKGFNKEPLTKEDRFYFLRYSEPTYENIEKYHGVKLAKEWSLDDLPSEEDFLKSFESEDEEQ